ASIAAPDARRHRDLDSFAPGAQPRGDMLAVGGQNLVRVSAAGKLALVQPPYFIGEAADQFLLVRDEQHSSSGAAYAVQRNRGALPPEQILAGKGVIDQQDRRGNQVQRV